MNIFTFTRSPCARILVTLILCANVFTIFLPTLAAAQGLTDGAPTGGPAGQTDANTSGCTWYNWIVNWSCVPKALAVYSSSAIIYLTGWALGIAGVLMNASLELTTVGFDSQIYNRVQGGIEVVWTAFRDIANILIIGMFTFTALTMILGIESFNARKMVAKVLLIAVLINFSLLFTRLIIASSNFVATQFYKAAQFGAEPAASTATAAASFGQYSTGISGKFAQLMGVASFANTSGALWKTAESGNDYGFMALALGLLTAIVMIAAALMFFYISFLLIARAILFIVLLITSSLAFASHLVPEKLTGGYGWDAWWGALLKNAVLAPLLLMLLWATIQLGIGIKGITGSGTLGGLLSDPSTGGNINALFSYLLILGMLYASVKIASSFANKIGGFSFAALAPALGAGFLGRIGGFAGRQTLGRVGANIGGRFAQRAKDADPGSTAQKLYNFGAKGFSGVAKRDFNLMRTQLGSEIQGVAKVKSIDTLAGKAIGGFQGAQDTFKKQMAESAKNLAYTDEEKKAKIKKELEAKSKSDPTFKAAYDKAEKDHEIAKHQLDDARKQAAIETGSITTKYKSKIEKMEQDRLAAETAYNSGTGSKGARDNARKALKETVEEQKLALNIESNKIKRAEATVNRAAQEFENLSTNVIDAAVKAKKLPEKFATAGEIAEASVKSSFTALLRATTPTAQGVEKLAEKIGKEAGKPRVDKNETVHLARQVAREKLGEEKKH